MKCVVILSFMADSLFVTIFLTILFFESEYL
jgi:hypothetical protein